MDSIMRMIGRQEVWENFLAYRLRKGRLTWTTFQEADDFVGDQAFEDVARKFASGDAPGVPFRTEINKMGSGKKRVVYQFNPDEMSVLKLISYLLYRYDDRFSPGCYSFRRGVRASDAIFSIRRELRGRQMWAYKVDIHNYFNSISIPILMPILKDLLRDDPELCAFFERLLSDDRSLSGETLIRENRGVMAGVPTAPFLADVYLMEVDRHFFEEGVVYARYSDDIILFAPDYEELLRRKAELLDYFGKYRLEVNPDKEHVYSPDEPFEFLGFRCLGNKIDISSATLEKMKGRIRRKTRSLRRWVSKKGKDPVLAMKALVRSFNNKFFESDGSGSLSWSRWFFPVINQTEGMAEIDHYLQDNIRYLYSGHHNKAVYRVRYTDLKALGYRSLVGEYHKWRETTSG